MKVLAILLPIVLGLLSCAQQERERQAIDQELLAALGLAQAYHHQSAELEALGDEPRAVVRAEKVLEIPFPPGVPEREDVRLDAHGRIAELLLAQGDDSAARAAVELGLAEATRPSYFKARLFAVEGRILRASARRLREEGDEPGASRAARAAIASFERSIEINRSVLGLSPAAGEGRDREGANP